MKPRIVKKLSKRLVEIAPSLFAGAWVNNEVELFTKHYAFMNDGIMSPKQSAKTLRSYQG